VGRAPLRRAPRRAGFVVHEEPAVFGAPGWDALAAVGARDDPFARPAWLEAWWRHFGGGQRLSVLELRAPEGACQGYAALATDGSGCARFLGGADLTDYLGPIGAAGGEGSAADALVDWLVESGGSQLDARFMQAGAARALAEAAWRRGLSARVESDGVAPSLALPPTWDAYLATLAKKDRHELRRKRRRLHRECGAAAVRTSDEATFPADLDAFVELHRSLPGEKGRFMRPEIAAFLHDACGALMREGRARLDLLEVDGELLAATLSFLGPRTTYLYNSAYRHDRAHLSPGIVLLAHLLEESIAEGRTTFDFLRGDERYKHSLGGVDRELLRVRVVVGGA
jgi:CelD/BcsL family acetyltransferase involved in cellulose biosynthesis